MATSGSFSHTNLYQFDFLLYSCLCVLLDKCKHFFKEHNREGSCWLLYVFMFKFAK